MWQSACRQPDSTHSDSVSCVEYLRTYLQGINRSAVLDLAYHRVCALAVGRVEVLIEPSTSTAAACSSAASSAASASARNLINLLILISALGVLVRVTKGTTASLLVLVQVRVLLLAPPASAAAAATAADPRLMLLLQHNDPLDTIFLLRLQRAVAQVAHTLQPQSQQHMHTVSPSLAYCTYALSLSGM
jgi:hypothetical protein